MGTLKEGRKSDREVFASDFDSSFDVSALYDVLDQVYVVTEPDDNTVLWRIMTTKDNRVLLAKVEGYLSETAHTAALYRLDAGYYDPPEEPAFPAGTYTGIKLADWGAWYSMIPDSAWVRSLRVTITDDTFSVSGDRAPTDIAMPFEGEQVQYFLETAAGANNWYVADEQGEQTGWRLIERDGHLYVGYWRSFGEDNSSYMLCCFMAELSAQ